MSVDVGSVYTAVLTCTDPVTGLPANPTAAILTITLPDQTTYISGAGANPPVTLPPAQAGAVAYPFTLTQEGLHKFSWAITPNTLNAAPRVDYVNARAYASAVSLADAQDHLGGVTDPAKVARIRGLAAAATRYAEHVVGTLVPRVFTADWVPGEYAPVLRLPHGPALSTSAVTAARSVYPGGPAWAAAQLVVNVRPGTIRTTSLLNFWYGPWTVDYTAGVQVVNADIIEAILGIIDDLYTPARGLSVDIAEQAAEGLALPPYYHAPPRAQMLLDNHALPGFG